MSCTSLRFEKVSPSPPPHAKVKVQRKGLNRFCMYWHLHNILGGFECWEAHVRYNRPGHPLVIHVVTFPEYLALVRFLKKIGKASSQKSKCHRLSLRSLRAAILMLQQKEPGALNRITKNADTEKAFVALAGIELD